MRNRPIVVTAAISVLVLLAALASCGGGGQGGGKVTLTYGIWDATFQPGVEKVIHQFEQKYPNVSVKVQANSSTYWTKMQAAATAGNAPDVFWMNEPNFLNYAENGQLVSLAKYAKQDKVDLTKFPPGLMKSYQVGGQQYALPWITAMVGLWYNKALFDAKHVPYPNASWNWANVQKAAAKITDSVKGVYGIAAAMANQTNYYNTILQAGGTIISADHKKSGFDSPAAVKGIKFWTDLIKNGSSPTLQQMTDTTPEHLFESGKLAMFYGGSWEAGTFAKIPSLRNKVDVTVLPKGERRGTTVEGASNVIYAKTKHAKQAWQFVKFMATRQAQIIQAKTGIVLPAYAGTQTVWVKSVPQYHLQSFVDELAYASPYPASKNTAAWQDHEGDYLTPAWAGKESAAQACSKLAKAMNQALAKE